MLSLNPYAAVASFTISLPGAMGHKLSLNPYSLCCQKLCGLSSWWFLSRAVCKACAILASKAPQLPFLQTRNHFDVSPVVTSCRSNLLSLTPEPMPTPRFRAICSSFEGLRVHCVCVPDMQTDACRTYVDVQKFCIHKNVQPQRF